MKLKDLIQSEIERTKMELDVYRAQLERADANDAPAQVRYAQAITLVASQLDNLEKMLQRYCGDEK